MENLDILMLTIDEMVDEGIILETDTNAIQDGVSMKGAGKEAPLTEQTLAQAWSSARETFANTFR